MKQKKLQSRHVDFITVDGLEFKDLNGNGKLDPYEDWRLSPQERAENLVSLMTPEEKAGIFPIFDLPMGISAKEGEATSHDGIILEVEEEYTEGPFTGMTKYPTTKMIQDMHMRHFLVRENAKIEEIAQWVNTLQKIAEEFRLGIPVIVTSNSRNEKDKAIYNSTATDSHFTEFPGTLGLAAGHQMERIKEWATIGHQEFLASNIRKGCMYMVDTATDPRWFRTYGTFGEYHPQISEIIQEVIPFYQGEFLDENSIALTIKHFPGGGVRENGFDPHYVEGQYNVYPTANSLQDYHLPPFQTTIDAGASSIMPYYAIPSNDKSHTPQPSFDGDFQEEIAFAYNKEFLQDLLVDRMGFKGYINTDTGVLDSMAWGAEDLARDERVARMLTAGSALVSGTNDVEIFQQAIEQGVVDEATVNKRLVENLTEHFQLGLFENPYVDITPIDQEVVAKRRETAFKAHQESVVLLKNAHQALPLQTGDKKVYVELLTKEYTEEEVKQFEQKGLPSSVAAYNELLQANVRQSFPEVNFVDSYEEADQAILLMRPVSGSYFEATDDYLDLKIHKDTHIDLDYVQKIRDQVEELIVDVHLDLSFILENIEPLADGLTVSFATYLEAILSVHLGEYAPTAKLPITLPANQASIAVNEQGICASPNDVPGYDKEKHMDIPYAYQDGADNRYVYGYGLTYD